MDDQTFYVCPVFNPDGLYNSIEKGISQRRNSMNRDDDEEGKVNEDGPDDLNADGYITRFRYKDPKGQYVMDDKDPRLMLRLRKGEKTDKERYSIIWEDRDNDGDGKRGEDSDEGIDLNRNFPYGWNLRDGNPYPMSEPETRNVYEFQIAHPNIYASFHYHNTGRLIMFQAPPERPRQGQSSEMSQRFQEMNRRRQEELKKANKYAQFFDREVEEKYQHDMDVQTEIVTMGARILKNYRPTIAGLSGQAHAATHYMLGAYGYLIELWGSPEFEADENNDGRVSDEEYLKWIDTELTGEGWISPHKVNHPDLGEIWIGGSPKKHLRRTPPARYIEMEAMKNAQFVMYCASQFPRVTIEDVNVTPVTEEMYWVEAEVKNDRVYPTSSDRAVQLKRDFKDKISIKTSQNISVVDIPGESTIVDQTNKMEASQPVTKKPAEFRLKGKETKTFVALVKMNGSKGWLEFKVDSFYGGKDTQRITLLKK